MSSTRPPVGPMTDEGISSEPRRSTGGSRSAEMAGVTLFFVGVAVYATWPLAKDPLSGFYGFGNDNWGGIWIARWLHKALWGPGSLGFSPELQAPMGLRLPDHAIQPIDRVFAFLFGNVDEGLFAYNLQIFLGFVLSGITCYLLVKHLTGDRLASLVGGFVYTFSPFHLALAMQYGALSSIQWVPLFVWALLRAVQKPTVRRAVIAGLSYALLAAGSYYYAWFAAWFVMLVLVGLGIWGVTKRAGVRNRTEIIDALKSTALYGGLSGLVAAAACATFVLPAFLASRDPSVVTDHGLSEAIRYSARPWMFVLPPHDNPFLGSLTRGFIQTHLFSMPVYEQGIYLGYTALGLTALALLRRRSLPQRAKKAIPFMVIGILAAGALMVGPYIPLDVRYYLRWDQPDATRHLPWIGYLMSKISGAFRFSVRAFVLLSVCLSSLAGIGFLAWTSRVRKRSTRWMMAGLTILLVFVEFANAPPHVWWPERNPDWVAAVRTLPPGSAVVDYPIATANSPRSFYYMFWQTRHGRPTLNPPITPAAQALAAAVASLDDPMTPRKLQEAGFDFVIVHTKLPPQTFPPYQPVLPDDSLPSTLGRSNPDLLVHRVLRDAVIYRVRVRSQPQP